VAILNYRYPYQTRCRISEPKLLDANADWSDILLLKILIIVRRYEKINEMSEITKNELALAYY